MTSAFWSLAENPGNLMGFVHGRQPVPAYYSYKLLASHMSGAVLHPSGVPTGFSVYASHDSGKAITSIAVLNKTPSDARLSLVIGSQPGFDLTFPSETLSLVTIPDGGGPTSLWRYSRDVATSGPVDLLASGGADSGVTDSGASEVPTVTVQRAGGTPISPFAFGNNYWDWVDWSHNGTYALQGTEDLVKAMHINVLVANNNNTDMDYPEVFDNAHIDKYIAYCRAIGAEPIMEVPILGNNVNAGPTSAQTAADMVTYVNGTKHYGVKYWTIGDEADFYTDAADDDVGTPSSAYGPNNPIKTADDLCATYKSYAAAMKAANDATGSGVDIKFVGPELAGKYWPGSDWLTPFLDGCKDYVDVVSVHYYGFSGAGDSIQGALYDADTFRAFLAYYQQLVAAHARPDTPIAITETAVAGEWQRSVYTSDSIQAAPGTYYSALWDIDRMGVALQANLWTLAFWNLAEPDDPSTGNVFGNILSKPWLSPPAYRLTPDYYAQQLIAGNFSGTTVIPSGVPSDFSVYASYDPTKASTVLAVVNKNSVAAPLTIAIDSLAPQTMTFGPLAITLVTVPDDPNATTDVIEYSPDLANAGQPPKSIQ